MPTYPSALVSLDDVLDWLNIPDSQSDVVIPKLLTVIDAAQAFVEFQTGPIVPQSVTETRDGGSPIIMLDNPPIISVDSVLEIIGTTSYTLTAGTIGSSGAYGYALLDAQSGKIGRLYSGGIIGPFMGGRQNIQITYTAGRASVPDDVRLAVLEDIRGLYTQTQYGSPASVSGAGSTSPDDWSETAGNPIGSFPRLAALLQGPSRTPSIA